MQITINLAIIKKVLLGIMVLATAPISIPILASIYFTKQFEGFWDTPLPMVPLIVAAAIYVFIGIGTTNTWPHIVNFDEPTILKDGSQVRKVHIELKPWFETPWSPSVTEVRYIRMSTSDGDNVVWLDTDARKKLEGETVYRLERSFQLMLDQKKKQQAVDNLINQLPSDY